MGYSTYFKGFFGFSQTLSVTQKDTLRSLGIFTDGLDSSPVELPETPEAECPWVVTDQGTLEDLCEEKMNDWLEWLNYLVDHVFTPQEGATLEGKVVWQGEETGDAGIIFASGGQCHYSSIDMMPAPEWYTPPR